MKCRNIEEDKKKPSVYRCHGFTVIELVMVVIIVGVLAATAASLLYSGDETVTEAEILKGHLRYAQFRAMRDIPPVRWGINIAAGSYTLVRDVSGSQTSPVNLPGERETSTHTFLAGVTATAGTGSVLFDDWGAPVGGGRSITLSGGGRSTTVTVTQITGFIP